MAMEIVYLWKVAADEEKGKEQSSFYFQVTGISRENEIKKLHDK
jgi:hypothetical protein